MVREVIVTGKLDVSDVMKFMFHHNYSRTGGALTGIMGVISIVVAPFMFLTGDMVSAIILSLVGLMYGILTPLGFYTKASRQIRMNPVFKNDMTFRFGSDDLQVNLYTGQTTLLWQDVYQIKVLKTQLLIYLKEANALILPLRNFVSEEDIELVKDFIVRNRLDIPHTRRLEVEIHDEDL